MGEKGNANSVALQNYGRERLFRYAMPPKLWERKASFRYDFSKIMGEKGTRVRIRLQNYGRERQRMVSPSPKLWERKA